MPAFFSKLTHLSLIIFSKGLIQDTIILMHAVSSLIFEHIFIASLQVSVMTVQCLCLKTVHETLAIQKLAVI